jgi:hypothetical protein
VDIRTDHKLLYKQWLYIPPGKHLDLQDMLKIPGYGNRAGMATMASELIHPKYAGMKEKFVHDYDRFEGHNFWEWKPLSDMNLEYASIDGYVTYELARIVTIVNQGLHPQRPLIPSWDNNERKRRRGHDN